MCGHNVYPFWWEQGPSTPASELRERIEQEIEQEAHAWTAERLDQAYANINDPLHEQWVSSDDLIHLVCEARMAWAEGSFEQAVEKISRMFKHFDYQMYTYAFNQKLEAETEKARANHWQKESCED